MAGRAWLPYFEGPGRSLRSLGPLGGVGDDGIASGGFHSDTHEESKRAFQTRRCSSSSRKRGACGKGRGTPNRPQSPIRPILSTLFFAGESWFRSGPKRADAIRATLSAASAFSSAPGALSPSSLQSCSLPHSLIGTGNAGTPPTFATKRGFGGGTPGACMLKALHEAKIACSTSFELSKLASFSSVELDILETRPWSFLQTSYISDGCGLATSCDLLTGSRTSGAGGEGWGPSGADY